MCQNNQILLESCAMAAESQKIKGKTKLLPSHIVDVCLCANSLVTNFTFWIFWQPSHWKSVLNDIPFESLNSQLLELGMKSGFALSGKCIGLEV